MTTVVNRDMGIPDEKWAGSTAACSYVPAGIRTHITNAFDIFTKDGEEPVKRDRVGGIQRVTAIATA